MTLNITGIMLTIMIMIQSLIRVANGQTKLQVHLM